MDTLIGGGYVMEHVGIMLKAKREETGLSLEEISEQTKITTPQLVAVEKGNVSYFGDDVSFYRFRALAYGRAVGLDEAEIKAQVERDIALYQQSIQDKKAVKIQTIEKNIKKQTNAKRKRQIDFSWLGMIAVIAIVIITLVVVFIKYIVPELQPKAPTGGVAATFPIVVDYDDSIVDNQTPLPNPTEPAKTLTISKTDPKTFVVTGYQEKMDLSIILVNFSSVSVYQNDIRLANPEAKVYGNETIVVPLEIKDNDVVKVTLGYIKGSKMLLNDQEIPLDESYINQGLSIEIQLQFKGDS